MTSSNHSRTGTRWHHPRRSLSSISASLGNALRPHPSPLHIAADDPVRAGPVRTAGAFVARHPPPVPLGVPSPAPSPPDSAANVAEMIGNVTRLSGNTFDLGAEDGINVVVTDF
jgi:hypothetical protein